jgi:EmrB/QacA subfamily drug resistance transporter
MQELDNYGQNWTLGVTALASFMVALDAMVLTAALATIRADFSAPMATLQWTVNAYNLSFAVLLLTGAALGDRFGRRRMFAAGIALFMLASIACALSTSILALIAARSAQGAGAALVMPVAMAILSGAFAREERARALGIFSGVTGLALIVGPAIGGFLTEGFGWRWIFWINVPIGLIALAMSSARLRESFGPPAGLDIPGLILVAAAAFAVVWGLLRGNGSGWTSAEVVVALLAGLLLTAAFIGRELRADAPMVPMRLFRSRALSSGIAASFLFYAAMYGTLFLLPQFFQASFGYGPLGAGLRLLPWTATLFATAPIAGAVVNRVGERPLVVAGLSMQAAGLGWIAMIVGPGTAYPDDRRAAGPCRRRRIDGDAGGSERGLEFGRRGRDRQGIRHLQHGAIPGWRVRCRTSGRNILRQRRHPFAREVQRRLRGSDAGGCCAVIVRRLCRIVAAGAAARTGCADATEGLTSTCR